jgi:hypothetical protein
VNLMSILVEVGFAVCGGLGGWLDNQDLLYRYGASGYTGRVTCFCVTRAVIGGACTPDSLDETVEEPYGSVRLGDGLIRANPLFMLHPSKFLYNHALASLYASF